MAIARRYAARLRQLTRAHGADALWVYAELFPYLPAAFERLAFAARLPVVYDFDDAFFHQYEAARHPLVRRMLSGKLEPLLRGAAACACGNAYLRDYAERFCDHTIILPTVVDTSTYRPISGSHAGQLSIGWIGTPSTWQYVRPMLPLLTELAAKRGLRVRVVGAGAAAATDRFDGLDLVDWHEATEIEEVQRMDVGIMPLPDEAWARGKSGYKLVQYMACGLPVVASPVGVNAEIVLEGETGFLARSPEQWRHALVALLDDAALRRRMGQAGRRRAEAQYSLDHCAPQMVELLRGVAGDATGMMHAQRRRIVIVDPSIAPTGALRAAVNIARAIAPEAEPWLVLAAHAQVGDVDLRAFTRVIRVPMRQIRRSPIDLTLFAPTLLAAGLRLRRMLRDDDVLVVNDFYLLHGWLLRRLGFRGRIVTWVRIDPRAFPETLRRAWIAAMRAASNQIVAVSAFIVDRLSAEGVEARLVYDPVDPSLSETKQEAGARTQRIVQIANYTRGKGQNDAIAAFRTDCTAPSDRIPGVPRRRHGYSAQSRLSRGTGATSRSVRIKGAGHVWRLLARYRGGADQRELRAGAVAPRILLAQLSGGESVRPAGNRHPMRRTGGNRAGR